MRTSIKLLVTLAGLASASAVSKDARACSATETQVYKSAATAWCVENAIVTQYGTFPSAFYSYGDNVIAELVSLFDVPAQGVYTFEASVVNGSAHTGSECCGLGVTVTGDAFYGSAYGATAFWGYLLSLHESINDWTGQVSSGWPTDFWADHVSAYPNSMDWQIMSALGKKLSDANLSAASVAQKARFYPGGDSADPRVPMFDTIFAMPGMGFPGWSRIFSYVEGDKMSWDGLGVANPAELRTEYVFAYVSLGPGISVLPTATAANVANGTDDGAGQNDPVYTAKESVIDAVATAHCSIAAAKAAGTDETADLKALQSGKYASVTAQGACGAGCPAECGCKTSTKLCVAPWLADALPDGGAEGSGETDSGAPGHGSGTPDASLPLEDAGPVAPPSSDEDGGTGRGVTGGTSPTSSSSSSSGCGCTVAGLGSSSLPWLAVASFLGLALLRGRTRRR